MREIEALVPKELKIYGLKELNIYEDIPETGNTIEKNSGLKATYVYTRHKMPVFSEDSGLEVRSLNGAPGVYSARYAGTQKNDEDNINLLLKHLSGMDDRTARFKSVITYINWNGKKWQFTGTVEGHIGTSRRGSNGFGYDPIFIPKGLDRTFAEMEGKEKNAISHRYKSFQQLLAHFDLKKWMFKM